MLLKNNARGRIIQLLLGTREFLTAYEIYLRLKAAGFSRDARSVNATCVWLHNKREITFRAKPCCSCGNPKYHYQLTTETRKRLEAEAV